MAAAVLLGCLVLWLVLDPLKYELIEAQRQGVGMKEAALAAIAGLGAPGWLLIAASGGAVALMVGAELRGRAVSRALGESERAATLALFAALLLWFGHAYLYAGHLLGGDTGAHITRIAHFARGLDDGQLLHWSNHFYGGATFLQFTSPIFFWIGGVLAWAMGGEAVWATKISLLALHFAAGFAQYVLLRHFRLPRSAACIGAIVYAGAFAHLHLVLYKGALPATVVLPLLPLLFVAADRMAVAPGHVGRAWASLALLVGLLVIGHQPTGFIAGLYLAAYVAVSVAIRRYPARTLMRAATAAAAAAALAGIAVVPWLAEGQWVMAYDDPRLLYWEWPDGTYFAKLLVWGNSWTSQGTPSVAYVGATSALLALAALAWLKRGREFPLAPLVAIFAGLGAISLALRGAHVRDIIFTLLFIATLAGFGAAWLLARLGGGERVALALLVLVMLDLGPTAVQPLARRDKGYLDAASSYLVASAPGERAVLLGSYRRPEGTEGLQAWTGASATPFSYHAVSTLAGPHSLAATRLHNYLVAVLKRVEADLVSQGALSPSTVRLLAMLDAGWIVNDNGTGMGLPESVRGATEEGPLGRAIRVPGPTPAVFAPRLAAIEPPAIADKPVLWDSAFEAGGDAQVREVEQVLDRVLEAMSFSAETATASAIPVRGTVAEDPAAGPAEGAPAAAGFTILEHREDAEAVRLRLGLAEPGFVQLAYAWYPYLAVTVDGAEVTPLQGTLNLIVLPMQAGEHEVEVVAQRSSLRVGFGVFCWAVFAALLAIAVWPRRQSS